MPSDTHNGSAGPEPPPEPQPVVAETRSSRRYLAPVAAVAGVAVVAVVAGLLVVGHRSGDPASPPVLHLRGAERTLALAVGEARGDSAAGARPSLSGELPTKPDSAPVRSFAGGSAPKDRVVDLARALGLSGNPERHNGTWVVRDGDRTLSVSGDAGWRWTLSPLVTAVPLPYTTAVPAPPSKKVTPAPPATVEPPQQTVPTPVRTPPTMSCMVIINGKRACPPATPLERRGGKPAPGMTIPEHPDGITTTRIPTDSGAGSGTSSGSDSASNSGAGVGPSGGMRAPTAPKPAEPSAARIRKAASPTLAALDLTDAHLTVRTRPGRGQVTADPLVDGLPTSGYSTVLTFDNSTNLILATGWLADPRPGARYPLVPAADALTDRQARQARCDPCVAPAQGQETVVTDARLGLVRKVTDESDSLLVPAWFYQVRDSDQPMVLVAVDPQFLAGPRSGPGKHPGAADNQPGQVVNPANPADPDSPDDSEATGAPAQPKAGAVEPAEPTTSPTH